MEDQLTTWIAAGVSFIAGWVLDNGIPRKIAKFVISLVSKKKAQDGSLGGGWAACCCGGGLVHWKRNSHAPKAV